MSIFFYFVPPLCVPRSGKNFIVIPFVVFEILGGYFHPSDAIRLSEKADAINR